MPGEGLRERESSSSLPADHRAQQGESVPGPQDDDLIGNQESAAQPTEPPRHPPKPYIYCVFPYTYKPMIRFIFIFF